MSGALDRHAAVNISTGVLHHAFVQTEDDGPTARPFAAVVFRAPTRPATLAELRQQRRQVPVVEWRPCKAFDGPDFRPISEVVLSSAGFVVVSFGSLANLLLWLQLSGGAE
jgi:hypothetical protein